jgi:hypothetical protein
MASAAVGGGGGGSSSIAILSCSRLLGPERGPKLHVAGPRRHVQSSLRLGLLRGGCGLRRLLPLPHSLALGRRRRHSRFRLRRALRPHCACGWPRSRALGRALRLDTFALGRGQQSQEVGRARAFGGWRGGRRGGRRDTRRGGRGRRRRRGGAALVARVVRVVGAMRHQRHGPSAPPLWAVAEKW